MNKPFLFVSLICFYFNVAGQIENFIPPSPNAASLGKYGEIPVNNYTGVASFSIPLYTAYSGSLEVPISLNYHTSGIKVAQEASWVGLGWALNAGGVITRQIRGVDDLKSTNGYIDAPALPDPRYGTNMPNYSGAFGFYNSDEDLDLYGKIEEYHAGMVDSQPDFFYYNFLNHAGKLIIPKQDGNLIHAIPTNQNNFKFSYDRNNEQWIIVDDKGCTYFFGTKEISRSASATTSVFSPTPTAMPSLDVISSWYIDKVISPEGDSINFIYNSTGRFIKDQVSYSQRRYMRDGHLGISGDKGVNGDPGFISANVTGNYKNLYTATVTEVDEVYLKRINFANGYILFNSISREDRIQGDFSTKSPALQNFVIYNNKDIKIKSIGFAYDYFNNEKLNTPDQENYLRLKLTSVQEQYPAKNGGYLTLPAYEFIYDSVQLPAKNSFSVDYWGFFNGANNSSIRNYKFLNLFSYTQEVNQTLTDVESALTPRFEYIGSSDENNVKVFINGANRNPNLLTMQAGILKEIKYPTDGILKFEYESNDFYEPNLFTEQEIEKTAQSGGDSVKQITLTKSSFVFFSFNLINHYYDINPNEVGVFDNVFSVLEKENGTKIIEFIPSDEQMDGEPGGSNNVNRMDAYICVALEPGVYYLKANNGGKTYLNITLKAKFIEKIPTEKKAAGGIRIKSIERYDAEYNKLLSKRTFRYTEWNTLTSKSSGRLMYLPKYIYNETDLLCRSTDYEAFTSVSSLINSICFPCINSYIYLVNSSESHVPMSSSAQGASVGYDKVWEIDENNNGESNGSSLFIYKNLIDSASTGVFFPGIPNYVHLQNGQLLREEIRAQNGMFLESRNHEYATTVESKISQKGIVTMKPQTPLGDAFIEYCILARFYEQKSEWWKLTADSTFSFSSDGSGYHAKTTNKYYFENPSHKQVTRKKIINSDGKQIDEYYIYPTDVNSELYRNMSDKNIINHAIEKRIRIDNKWTKGSLTKYTLENGMYLPSSIYVTDIASPLLNFSSFDGVNMDSSYCLSPVIEYLKYDTKGNIAKEKLKNGIYKYYLWAYSRQYPIAEIESTKSNIDIFSLQMNVDNLLFSYSDELSDIKDDVFIVSSFLDTLHKDTECQVTFYTYKPLVGMTSQTDPNGFTTYYEYDSFGRLSLIRDHNENIIKKYDYHYAGQPVNN